MRAQSANRAGSPQPAPGAGRAPGGLGVPPISTRASKSQTSFELQADPPSNAGLEPTLTELEATIAKLAEGTAPLDELVSAHQRAIELLAKATAHLEELSADADAVARSLSE